MMKKMLSLSVLMFLCAATTLLSLDTHANPRQGVQSKGWNKTGLNHQQYKVGFEQGQSSQIGFIKSRPRPQKRSYATVMRTIDVEQFHGKRIELTTLLKTKNAASASAWVKVDGKFKTLSMDKMDGRRLSGTKDWQDVSIVVDIPPRAVSLSYGIMLNGKGKVWFELPVLRLVNQTVATTDSKYRSGRQAIISSSFTRR